MSTLILTGFWNRFLTGSGSGTGFLWIVSFNSTNMGINGKGLMSTLILTGFWNRFLTGSGSGTGFFFRFHLVKDYIKWPGL